MIEIFPLILTAGETREIALSGDYFELRNAVGVIPLIELIDRSGGVLSRVQGMEQSDYIRPGRFETVRVTNGTTAQTVKFFIGTGDAGSRRFSGLVQVVGDVTVADVRPLTMENSGPAAITNVETALASFRLIRRSVRFTNLGPDPVAIGAAGLTWAKRCIVLNAGDTWVEDTASNLAWVAITESAGKTASITTNEVLS